MISITDAIVLHERDFDERFVRASDPPQRRPRRQVGLTDLRAQRLQLRPP
jgi:hypothetical protein